MIRGNSYYGKQHDNAIHMFLKRKDENSLDLFVLVKENHSSKNNSHLIKYNISERLLEILKSIC